MSNAPLMPKATAVWLVDNTALTFDQVADFTKMHPLEVRAIADGDAAQGIKGMDPISNGQLTREEIERGERDQNYRLRLQESKVVLPSAAKKKGPRYTPVSRRHERPSAILWLVRNHPELKDAQIMRLVGTTKTTIASVRDRTHWNASTLTPMDPVTLGLCSQIDLDFEVQRAAKEIARGTDFRELAGPGCKIPKTEERAITLKQLVAVMANIKRRCEAEGWKGDFYPPQVAAKETRALTAEMVRLYDADKYVIRPATVAALCSLVELLATGPQPPLWFVSHWWGEPVRDFVACIVQHARDHGLGDDACYWVCAYANNQWTLGELDVDLEQTSFHKALALSVGTVSVLDREGVAYTRRAPAIKLAARSLPAPASHASEPRFRPLAACGAATRSSCRSGPRRARSSTTCTRRGPTGTQWNGGSTATGRTSRRTARRWASAASRPCSR